MRDDEESLQDKIDSNDIVSWGRTIEITAADLRDHIDKRYLIKRNSLEPGDDIDKETDT